MNNDPETRLDALLGAADGTHDEHEAQVFASLAAEHARNERGRRNALLIAAPVLVLGVVSFVLRPGPATTPVAPVVMNIECGSGVFQLARCNSASLDLEDLDLGDAPGVGWTGSVGAFGP